MAGRYDEEYTYFLSKLNDTYERNKSERGRDSEAFKDILPDKQKLIDEMPYEEFRKVKAKIRYGVTDIGYLTNKEQLLLENINDYSKLNFKVAAWRLTGPINAKQFMKNYVQIIQKYEVFRTVYLYKGLKEPVRVVYQNKETTFPINDIRNMSYQKQNFVIKNVLAAEARRDYNMESDSVFRIQGYLTRENEMMVVISVYPYLPFPIGMNKILSLVFQGMHLECNNVPTADAEALNIVYEQLRQKSLEHWQEIFLPLENSLLLPGEKINPEDILKKKCEKAILYKELGTELTEKVLEFCKKSKISIRAVFLYAWAEMLGRYRNVEHPIVAVTQSGGKMNLFPVRISRDKNNPERLHDIDKQLEQAPKYIYSTVKEVESSVGIAFAEYFRIVHNFIDFSDISGMENDFEVTNTDAEMQVDTTDINLCVTYQMFQNNIMMNYVSRGDMMELMLGNLHELFIEQLSMIVLPDSARFDKKSFIKVDDTDEEKMYKIQLAQIALYLKKTGVFESISVEEIMKLAEYCKLRTYLQSDTIVSEKSMISNIYILGDGKLEESRMDMDGMVKSLRIAKPGSVLGIESLFQGGEAQTTYTVAGPQAKVVEMDKNVLIEVLRRKPEGWITLLEKESDQKNRMQRLWIME